MIILKVQDFRGTSRGLFVLKIFNFRDFLRIDFQHSYHKLSCFHIITIPNKTNNEIHKKQIKFKELCEKGKESASKITTKFAQGHICKFVITASIQHSVLE